MKQPDIVIAGAGIIGLSLALELRMRGLSVVVLEAGKAHGQASTAAAGMLAALDPHNPPALAPLAALGADLYPEYLDRIAELSGRRVDFQTSSTLQAVAAGSAALEDPTAVVPQMMAGPHRFSLLDEHSVDPRELAPALLAAVLASGVQVLEGTPLHRVHAGETSIRVEAGEATTFDTGYLVDCMGAWTPAPVVPRKGQMLAVQLPPGLPLETVVRTENIYIVPRTLGPRGGSAVIGATVEYAGFDLTVHPKDLLALTARAALLLPQITQAAFVEAWAGLRPGTRDELPLLGPVPRRKRYLLANGHYRNGILLAPATARVMAQMLAGEATEIDLTPFSPDRF